MFIGVSAVDGDFSSNPAAVMVTSDGGLNWSKKSVPSVNTRCFWGSISSPVSGSIIIAGSSISVSTDSGATWSTPVAPRLNMSGTPADSYCEGVEPCIGFNSSTGRIVVGGAYYPDPNVTSAWDGVIQWADSPYSSWTKVILNTANKEPAITLYIPGGGFVACGTEIDFSADGATSWSTVLPAVTSPGSSFWTTGASKPDGSMALLGGFSGNSYPTNRFSIAKSTNGGSTWTTHDGVPMPWPGLGNFSPEIIWDTSSNQWYACGFDDTNIWSSAASDGFSWSSVVSGVSGDTFWGVNRIGSYLYAFGGTPGIYRSSNGSSWTRFDTSSSINGIYNIFGQDSLLSGISAFDASFWTSVDLGATWQSAMGSDPNAFGPFDGFGTFSPPPGSFSLQSIGVNT